MSRQNQSFAKSLLKGERAELIVKYLDESEKWASVWPCLSGTLAPEIHKFERHNIAVSLARILGSTKPTVTRRQTFLVRAAVNAILFPLEAYDDRLLQHIEEENGLRTLFHHTVREFSNGAEHPEFLMATADACRLAAFDLEDRLRRHVGLTDAVSKIIADHTEVVETLQLKVPVDKVPFGWTGIALLWVASIADLGTLPAESNTTEAFADDD